MSSTLLDKIREAGVVGCGGAGFPTHVKLAAKAGTFIANGAECEPMLECDVHAMRNQAREILEGMRLAMELVGAREGIFAIKAKNRDLPPILERELKAHPTIRLAQLPDVYPMGDEQVLVYETTGRMVPPGALPLAVDCVVQNVATLLAVARAARGEAYVTRWITVSGLVERPTTFLVPIGTPIRELLAAVGGLTRDDATLINGGPMTGRLVKSLDDPVTKTMGGLLALPPDSYVCREKSMPIRHHYLQSQFACFQCQDCSRVCPRFLLGYPFQPHMIMRAINYPSQSNAEILKTAHYCCDCGLCSLVGCQTMQLSPRMVCVDLKGKVERPEAPKNWIPEANPMREDVAIPSKRIKMRHGIEELAVHTELHVERLRPARVTIPLRQHIGAPAEAIVTAGQKVRQGECIARLPQKGLGANVHASIDGTVTQVTEGAVSIER